MINIKKLVAGFLVLATGATASVLIFSSLTSSSINNNSPKNIAEDSNPSPIGNNAFLAQNIATLSPEITNSPDNLTGTLTDTMLTNIMNANPQGPTTDANGNQIMVQPDQEKMLAELSGKAAFKNFKSPNWDLEADKITVNVTKKYSDEDLAMYVSAVSDALNKNLIKSGISGSLDQAVNNANKDSATADPSIMGAITPSITDTLNDVARLTVPGPLAKFQKSLIKLLVYEKNTAQTTSNTTQDPVRTSLILQSKEKEMSLAIQSLENETQKAIQSGTLSFNKKSSIGTPEKNPLSLITSFFGIKTANAQYIVKAPATDLLLAKQQATTFADKLQQFATKLALQLLKNTLVKFIQNKVLAWIQGSGMPRFITEWASVFINAYTSAAVGAIDSITPNICPSFAPLINVALKVTTPAVASGFQTCSMGSGNLQNFFNNFTGGGGWESYLNILRPNQNFYSSLLSVSDVVTQKAADERDAAKTKALANNGFTGDGKCADGSNPNGYHFDNSGYRVENKGSCSDGSAPQVTTPGKMTEQISAKALGSSVELTVTAQSIEGIALAMTESLMNSLMNTLQQSIDSSLSGSNNGGGGILSVQPSRITNSENQSIPVSCSPSSQTTSIGTVMSFLADGGSYDTIGNPPTYVWDAEGATPASSTGSIFTGSYNATGTYNLVVTAETDNSSSTCEVTVQ